MKFRSRHEAPPAIELKMRNHLYRIAQEAVQNALKHSGAKNIDIELWSRPGDLRLSVIDDGHGLATDVDKGSGLGMRTMRFRASAIGGRISDHARRQWRQFRGVRRADRNRLPL